MEIQINNPVFRHWWLSLIVGLLGIIAGICYFATPHKLYRGPDQSLHSHYDSRRDRQYCHSRGECEMESLLGLGSGPRYSGDFAWHMDAHASNSGHNYDACLYLRILDAVPFHYGYL